MVSEFRPDITAKYKPAVLPSLSEAVQLAEEREQWAKEAREQDRNGSAREFELDVLLLREYVRLTKLLAKVV